MLNETAFIEQGNITFQINKPPQAISFCFEINGTKDEVGKIIKDLKRYGKKVDINITSENYLQNQGKKKNEALEKAIRLGNRVNAAQSQQQSSKFRMNEIERQLRNMGRINKILAIITIGAFVGIQFWSNSMIKKSLRSMKL